MPLLSIIIVNFHQKHYLEICIESIRKHINCEYEIIIINNSPDEQLNIHNAIVLDNKNYGYSEANNLGYEKSSGKYLLFLNADTFFTRNFDEIQKIIERNEIEVAGIGLIYPNFNFQLSFWNEMKFFNEIKNKKAEKYFGKAECEIFDEDKIKRFVNLEKQNSMLYKVDWVSGAALLIERNTFKNTGGFDEKFFLFYEDADLCKRIQNSSKEIYYIPFNGLVHHKGEKINKTFLSDTYYHSKVSQIYYYKKHNNLYNRFLLRIYLFIKSLKNFLLQRNEINKKILNLSIRKGD